MEDRRYLFFKLFNGVFSPSSLNKIDYIPNEYYADLGELWVNVSTQNPSLANVSSTYLVIDTVDVRAKLIKGIPETRPQYRGQEISYFDLER